MKATTSLHSMMQQRQVDQIFVFYLFYCNLKGKDHIRTKINSKKKITCEISIIILIYHKIGLVWLVQQKIELSSRNTTFN